MELIGNQRAEELYACPQRSPAPKPSHSATRDERERYIRRKYEERLWAAPDLAALARKWPEAQKDAAAGDRSTSSRDAFHTAWKREAAGTVAPWIAQWPTDQEATTPDAGPTGRQTAAGMEASFATLTPSQTALPSPWAEDAWDPFVPAASAPAALQAQTNTAPHFPASMGYQSATVSAVMSLYGSEAPAAAPRNHNPQSTTANTPGHYGATSQLGWPQGAFGTSAAFAGQARPGMVPAPHERSQYSARKGDEKQPDFFASYGL